MRKSRKDHQAPGPDWWTSVRQAHMCQVIGV